MEVRHLASRKYRMDRRQTSVESTRRRIVEATMALHAQKGILGTSWKDIAEQADVSVMTVYKHFPSLNELVPACGALVDALTNPPSTHDASTLFQDANSLQERLGRLTAHFFAYYERAGPYLEVDVRERQLPAVQEWEAEMRSTREALVREALRAQEPEEAKVRGVSALLGFSTYRSFREHGVSRPEAEDIVQSLLLGWISRQA